MAKTFRMKRDREIGGKLYAKAGETVYSFNRHDFGLASDDTRMTGEEHKSVTLSEDGDYPFFTVPLADLEVSR